MDKQPNGKRNDGMGAVTTADNVDGAFCFLCGVGIHDGERIYVDLENDRTMHYSHVGDRVDYGVWMGTGVDLVGAVIIDDGEYLGYEHPSMEAQGFGVMYAGQAHYEYLSDGPTVKRFRRWFAHDAVDAGTYEGNAQTWTLDDFEWAQDANDLAWAQQADRYARLGAEGGDCIIRIV